MELNNVGMPREFHNQDVALDLLSHTNTNKTPCNFLLGLNTNLLVTRLILAVSSSAKNSSCTEKTRARAPREACGIALRRLYPWVPSSQPRPANSDKHVTDPQVQRHPAVKLDYKPPTPIVTLSPYDRLPRPESSSVVTFAIHQPASASCDKNLNLAFEPVTNQSCHKPSVTSSISLANISLWLLLFSVYKSLRIQFLKHSNFDTYDLLLGAPHLHHPRHHHELHTEPATLILFTPLSLFHNLFSQNY